MIPKCILLKHVLACIHRARVTLTAKSNFSNNMFIFDVSETIQALLQFKKWHTYTTSTLATCHAKKFVHCTATSNKEMTEEGQERRPVERGRERSTRQVLIQILLHKIYCIYGVFLSFYWFIGGDDDGGANFSHYIKKTKIAAVLIDEVD